MVEAVGRRLGGHRARLLLRLLEVAMVDALVVAQAVQRRVDALADVAHGLLGGTHVHVLDVALEACQGAQVLVARIAPEVVAAAACTIETAIATTSSVTAAAAARGIEAGIGVVQRAVGAAAGRGGRGCCRGRHVGHYRR